MQKGILAKMINNAMIAFASNHRLVVDCHEIELFCMKMGLSVGDFENIKMISKSVPYDFKYVAGVYVDSGKDNEETVKYLTRNNITNHALNALPN